MGSGSSIKRDVLRMYMAHPYPQWPEDERQRRLAFEISRYRFLGLDEALRGGRLLEVGCGTGMRSMLVAQYYDVKEFVGFDHSRASLDVAQGLAASARFDRFTAVEGDLFRLPYEDASFDVVVSWGVLHHTPDPWRGFGEMVRVCRPGGYVALFLYNRFNHWRHNLQKNRVSRRAGDDFEARFRVAHEIYGEKPVDRMTPMEVAEFYDKYCHPHKSDHTYGEILAWFDRLGLEYTGSFLPLRLRDLIGYIQYRDSLSDRIPLRVKSSRRLAALGRLLPAFDGVHPPFRRPGVVHRFIAQAALAWAGRNGGYSEGSAFSARVTNKSHTRAAQERP